MAASSPGCIPENKSWIEKDNFNKIDHTKIASTCCVSYEWFGLSNRTNYELKENGNKKSVRGSQPKKLAGFFRIRRRVIRTGNIVVFATTTTMTLQTLELKAANPWILQRETH